MASLICPDCREELLPQSSYERKHCGRCGREVFRQETQKVYCKDCGEQGEMTVFTLPKR